MFYSSGSFLFVETEGGEFGISLGDKLLCSKAFEELELKFEIYKLLVSPLLIPSK